MSVVCKEGAILGLHLVTGTMKCMSTTLLYRVVISSKLRATNEDCDESENLTEAASNQASGLQPGSLRAECTHGRGFLGQLWAPAPPLFSQ